jgi:hypothetical protein
MEPASLAKSMWLVEEGYLPNCRRNHGNVLAVGEYQADLELVHGYNNPLHSRTRHVCGSWYLRNVGSGNLFCTLRALLCRPWFTAERRAVPAVPAVPAP